MVTQGNIIDKKVAQAIIEERRNKEEHILGIMKAMRKKYTGIIELITNKYKYPFDNNELEQLKQMNDNVNSLIKNVEEIEEHHRKIFKKLDSEMDKLRESPEEITVNEIIEESSKMVDKRIIMFAEISAIMKKTKPFNTMRLCPAPEKDKWLIVNQTNERVRFKGTPEEIYQIIIECK